jgi:hypothetical protein
MDEIRRLMTIRNRIGAWAHQVKMEKLFKCQHDSALTRRNAHSLENPLRKLPAMIRWRDILPQITIPARALIF